MTRPTISKDAKFSAVETPTTDLTSLMLQTYTGSGSMTGESAAASQVSADSSGLAAVPKWTWLAGALAVWFLFLRRR